MEHVNCRVYRKEVEVQNVGFRRIVKELRVDDVNGDGITLKMVDECWDHLTASFQGPSESPFAGGTFCLDIKLPSAFPYAPPRVKFITHVWHPNVCSETGEMCKGFLLDWCASLTIRKLCIFIQSLLSNPDVEGATNPTANQYRTCLVTYQETVKYWTAIYASGPAETAELEAIVEKLFEEFGLSRDTIRLHLSRADLDYTRARDGILNPSRLLTVPPERLVAVVAPKQLLSQLQNIVVTRPTQFAMPSATNNRSFEFSENRFDFSDEETYSDSSDDEGSNLFGE